MSSRERWTIYPLLFLALGVSLRDKITSTLDLRSITCEELTVRSHDEVKRLSLDAANNHSGRLVLFGSDGKPTMALQSGPDGVTGNLLLLGNNGQPQVVLRSSNGAGNIETLTASGLPQIVLQSSPHGGVVKTVDSENQVIIALGHEYERVGLYGVDQRAGRTFFVPFGDPVPIVVPQQPPPGNAPPNAKPQQGAPPPSPPANPQPANPAPNSPHPEAKPASPVPAESNPSSEPNTAQPAEPRD